jgi:hypothetical protein
MSALEIRALARSAIKSKEPGPIPTTDNMFLVKVFAKLKRIIFYNRTQMNADNQDFNLILALNQKLNVGHLII